MSQKNVEIAKAGLAAFNAGGIESMLSFVHPDIEWRNADAGAGAAYRGHDALRKLFNEDFGEALEEMRQLPEDVIDLEGDKVLILTRFQARGRGSRLVLDEPWAFIAELRGGKLFRVETIYRSGCGPRSRGPVGVGDLTGCPRR